MLSTIAAAIITLNAAVFALLVFGAALDARARRRGTPELREPPSPATPCAICGKTHPASVSIEFLGTFTPIECPRCHATRLAPIDHRAINVGPCLECGAVMAHGPKIEPRLASDAEIDDFRRAVGPEHWQTIANRQATFAGRQLARSFHSSLN